MWVVKEMDGTTMGSYLRPMAGPLLTCVPMVAAVVGTHVALPDVLDVSPGVGLVLETLVGMVVYVPAALILARGPSRELVRLVRTLAVKQSAR
jgi:hypothetical protein